MAKKTRTDEPLTTEQQALAAEAFEFAGPIITSYRKKHSGRQRDYAGLVAMRICQHVSHFDAARSSLKTWAINQAAFACKDAIRATSNYTRRGNPRPRVCSLDAKFGARDGDGLLNVIAVRGDEPGGDESARHLLRGLTPLERAAVWETVVLDRTMREAAASHDKTESRICQVRAQALEFLRQHRGREATA